MQPDIDKEDFMKYVFSGPRREEWREYAQSDIDTSKLWEWLEHTLNVSTPFKDIEKQKKESEWDK